jgi:HK97 family phage major capsid protein
MDNRQMLDEFKQTWALMQRAMENKADKVVLDRFNSRLDSLEVRLQRPILAGMAGPNFDPPKTPDPDIRMFFKAVAAGGPERLRDSSERSDAERVMRDIETKATASGIETKALALGDDTLGGFLAPPEFVAEIVKGVQLISPVRQYAKVRPTVRRSVMVPVRAGVFAAQWVGESASRSETTGLAYNLDELPTYEMYAEVIVSNQDLEDSAFDLAADIADNAAEQFAKLEGQAFVNGTSVKQPEGFMTNSAIASDLCAGAGAIDAASIITFVYNLKSSYAANATLMMNRKTLGVVRSLKDSQQRFIWEPNYQVGTPPTILGIPYAEVPDMDDVGATKFPIAIRDFRRGYMIADRIDMSVLRMNEKYAEQGQVAFLIRKRVGGQVILPEAIRKLKSNNS